MQPTARQDEVVLKQVPRKVVAIDADAVTGNGVAVLFEHIGAHLCIGTSADVHTVAEAVEVAVVVDVVVLDQHAARVGQGHAPQRMHGLRVHQVDARPAPVKDLHVVNGHALQQVARRRRRTARSRRFGVGVRSHLDAVFAVLGARPDPCSRPLQPKARHHDVAVANNEQCDTPFALSGHEDAWPKPRGRAFTTHRSTQRLARLQIDGCEPCHVDVDIAQRHAAPRLQSAHQCLRGCRRGGVDEQWPADQLPRVDAGGRARCCGLHRLRSRKRLPCQECSQANALPTAPPPCGGHGIRRCNVDGVMVHTSLS